MSYLKKQPFDEKDFPAFATIREELGFLPNFFTAQTLRPDLIEAEINLTAAIMMKEGALTRKQKEYIFLVCSAENLSTYCVNAHCEIYRMLNIEGPAPEQIAINHRDAEISSADRTLLDFCSKLNHQAPKINPADIKNLHTADFNDQQILEAVILVGYIKFSNIVASGLGTVPDFRNVEIEQALSSAA